MKCWMNEISGTSLLQLVFGTGKFLPCIYLMNRNVFNQSFHETSWTKMFPTNATMKPHKPKCLSISVTPNLMHQNIFPAMLIQNKQNNCLYINATLNLMNQKAFLSMLPRTSWTKIHVHQCYYQVRPIIPHTFTRVEIQHFWLVGMFLSDFISIPDCLTMIAAYLGLSKSCCFILN